MQLKPQIQNKSFYKTFYEEQSRKTKFLSEIDMTPEEEDKFKKIRL